MFWQNKKIENIDIVFPYMSLSKQKKCIKCDTFGNTGLICNRDTWTSLTAQVNNTKS